MAGSVTTTVTTTTRRPKAGRPMPRSYWDPEYYADPRNATLARSILDPQYTIRDFTEAAFNRAQIAAAASMFGPGAERGIYEALAASPTVSPGVATALAAINDKLALPSDIVTEILALDATARSQDPNTGGRNPEQGSQGEKSGALAGLLGGFTRPMFALASMPIEMVMGGIRTLVGNVQGHEDPNAISMPGIPPILSSAVSQSLGGQYLTGLISPESADLGEGYIPRGDVHARQVQAARSAAPLVFNQAWTLGRGIGSLIYDNPDDLHYRNFSGIIDLTTNIALDPTVVAGKIGLAGRGIREAAALAGKRELGEATAKGIFIRETEELAERAETVAEVTRLVSARTMATANQVTRQAGLDYAQSQRTAAEFGGGTDLANLLARKDQLTDTERIIRSTQPISTRRPPTPSAPFRERETMLRTTPELTEAERGIALQEWQVGRNWRDAQARAAQGVPYKKTEDALLTGAIDTLRTSLGDEGLDAMTAKVVADAPELPGTFTDAIPMPLVDGPRALPGSDNGVDAIVFYDIDKAPVLRSVDDELDDSTGLAEAVAKDRRGRSRDRVIALDRLTTVVNRPGATYGDVLEEAIKGKTSAPITAFLNQSDIDGVSDVFRLTGGEAGVWWTNSDIRVARYTPNGEWALRDYSRKGQAQAIGTVKAQQKEVAEQLISARKKVSATNAVMRGMADKYAKTVDARTSTADSWEAVRSFTEFAYGMRRSIDGRPQISHGLLKEALFGPSPSFDAAIGVGNAVPSWVKIGEATNRATTGLMTLGISEAARAARRFGVDPYVKRTRTAVLDAMVRLDETPANLGLLHRLTNGKIDPELLKGVLRAQNEEQVLETLGPALGISIRRPIGPDVLNAARLSMHSMNGGRLDPVWHKSIRWMIDEAERLGTVAPRFGVHLNFADPAGSAALLRNYLTNLPGLDPTETDNIVGRYLTRQTEVGRAKEVRRAMDTVSKEISAWTRNKWNISEQTAETLREKMNLATRTHEGGRAQVNDWWTNRYAHDAHVGYMTSDGGLIHLVGPQLEAELARGGLVLPAIEQIRDAAGRWGKLIDRHPSVAWFRDKADAGMDYWRSAVLTRFAYIARNVGEMQFRMFLTGHSTVFNDPLSAMAMASAMNKRTWASRGLTARFARYNKTATGKVLINPDNADLDALDNVLPEFIETMSRTTSHHDMRSVHNAQAFHNVVPVGVDQPGFTAGWAEQLIGLQSSKLVRLVAGLNPPEVQAALKKGADRDTAIIDYLLTSPAAASLRREYLEAGESYAQIFTDPTALRAFLFDSSQGGKVADVSIRARVTEMTAGGNTELTEFLRTGVLKSGDNTLFTMSSRHPIPERRIELQASRAERLTKVLRPYRDTMPDDYRLNMRVLRHTGDSRTVLNKLFDQFFHYAGRKENAWAVGPEFAYAYNDSLVKLMPSMTLDTRQEIFDAVKKINGKWRGNSETMIKARAAMKAPDGTLIVEDVERVAARDAAEHVKGLFYDAQQRRQLFHSLRLIMPFAQAFTDTLWRWGRLTAARPYMVEKVGRLGIGLSEPGSSVIYDDFDWIDPFTNRESADPTQGFIHTDPLSGEQVFTFPLIGSILGVALQPLATQFAPGLNLAESMQLSAPVKNLNLAFQGDVDYLPGVGPLITIPTSLLMPDDWYGSAPEWFREYVFPFGKPRLEGGIVEAVFLPSWARRVTGALYNDSFRSYSYKGMLAYFVSTKDYPGLQDDPRAQQQLIEDVQAGSKIITFIRAIGAAFLPAAPSQDIYAADKDGNLIGTAYLSSHFSQLRQDAGGDYEQATQAFVDTYGMQALAAIVPVAEGELTISGPGWEWFKEHPEAKAFSGVIGAFFPGDFSYEANQWALNSGDRERLTVKQRTERMLQFMYSAEKRQIEGKAALNQWDAEATEQAEDDLRNRYGGYAPAFTGEDSAHKLAEIRNALEKYEDLRQTRGGEGATIAFDLYDEYEAAAQERFGQGLSARKSVSLREQFLRELDVVVNDYGGFNAKSGSVETIAGYFINVVTPRD